MGIVIPVSMIDKKDFVSRVQSIASKALDIGKTVIDAKELVIRPLSPRDLGLDVDEWKFSVSAGENTIINKQLDDKTLVVIYGVYNLSASPVTTELKFGTQAKIVEDIYIEDMYAYDYKVALLSEPVVYQPGSTVKISAVAKAASTDEKLGFLGFVVEPSGRKIG
jgi:hypothetical protein